MSLQLFQNVGVALPKFLAYLLNLRYSIPCDRSEVNSDYKNILFQKHFLIKNHECTGADLL